MRNFQDIIACAPTGSGKTLAFGLPILQKILTFKSKIDFVERNLFALIISPTRELSMQITEHLRKVSHFMLDITGLKMKQLLCPVVGGLSIDKQNRLLSYKPLIVISTPGRLWDLISHNEPHLGNLSKIHFFVLDEADRMLAESSYIQLKEVIAILEKQYL